MALMYSWATPEYCLWRMSWSQLIMYHNVGVEMKFGKQDDTESSSITKPSEMNYEQLSKLQKVLKAQYGDIDGK